MADDPTYIGMQNTSIEPLSLDLGRFMAWDNDSLVVTDQATLDKVERKALSPSTSKSMSSCQSRWLVERVLPREENPFDPAPLGTSGHLCLERMFLKPGEQRTADQLMIEVLTLADETWGTDVHGSKLAEKHRWVGEVHSKISLIFNMEDPTKVVVHTNELEMNEVKISGVPFIGFIDRVDIVTDENGVEGICVIDYKTGKVPKNITMFGDDHGDQLRLYALAYFAKYGVMPVSALIYYTAYGQVKKVSLAKSALNKTLRAFQTSWNSHNTAIETAHFNTKPSALCGWCPAVESCGSAIKKDGTMYARSPRAGAFVELGIPTFTERVIPVESPYDGDDEPIFDESMIRDSNESGLITDKHAKQSKKGGDKSAEKSQKGTQHTEENMSSDVKGLFGPEVKPWETPGDDRLNPNAFAATAVFGIVEIAVEALAESKEKMSPKSVRAVSGTLAKVVLDAQIALEGDVDWNAGLNTRLRGALRTTLKTMPLPFGGSAEDWETWVATATRRVLSTAVMAAALFDDFDPTSAEPWLVFTNE